MTDDEGADFAKGFLIGVAISAVGWLLLLAFLAIL